MKYVLASFLLIYLIRGSSSVRVSDSLSPESKKQKPIDEIMALLKLSRESFKDHKAYEQYLENFGKMKGEVNSLAKRYIDLEEKCDNLIRREVEAIKDKNVLEKLKFCNMYRMQIDRFEIIFAKSETYIQLTTFGKCLDLVLPIYAKERKLDHRKVIDLSKKKASIFREELTRIEKWRLIILWIFLESVVKLSRTNECENFEPELKEIESFAEKNKDQILLDYNKVLNSSILRAVRVLREFFLSTMKMNFSTNIYQMIIFEMKTMAKSVNDGYQVCSKEIKKIQSFIGTPEQYLDIHVQINPSDVENDILVA